MNRRSLSVFALAAAVFGTVLIPACDGSNALVGGECRVPYQACGTTCVDLDSDPRNCGTCGNVCAGGAVCRGKICVSGVDGSVLADGGDASVDGASGDATVDAEGGTPEAGPTEDTGAADSGSVDACAPPYTTADHCGDCFTVCQAPDSTCREITFGNYACRPPCDAPTEECNGQCLDLSADPFNCGVCGKFCPSLLCVNRVCQGATPGDVVVIGHDYATITGQSAQAKLLINAVFLPRTNPLRVLSYEKNADAATVARIKNVLDTGGGRRVVYTVQNDAAALAAPDLAQNFDVVLVYDQPTLPAANAEALGGTWAPALDTFVRAGGDAVFLDGVGGDGPMANLVRGTGLVNITGHGLLIPFAAVRVTAPFDSVASQVQTPYGAAPRSAALLTTEANGGDVAWVVRVGADGSGSPVVIHKSFR